MTRTDVLKMAVQISSAVLSNPVAAARVLSGPWDVQQLITDYANAVANIAQSLGVAVTEDKE